MSQIRNRGSGNTALLDIYKALIACSEVETLHLKIVQSGCTVGIDPWNFKFRPGDRFPALKDISLDGYDFDETLGKKLSFIDWQRGILLWLRDYIVDLVGTETLRRGPDSPSASNLEKWRMAMDWSKLERLDLANINIMFMRNMMGHLPSLKSFGLKNKWTDKLCIPGETQTFLEHLPTLSNLSLHGFKRA